MATKTSKLIKSMKKQAEQVTPIGTEMILPNHSGITDHPEFKDANMDELDVTGTGTFGAVVTGQLTVIGSLGEPTPSIHFVNSSGGGTEFTFELGSDGNLTLTFSGGTDILLGDDEQILFGDAKKCGIAYESSSGLYRIASGAIGLGPNIRIGDLFSDFYQDIDIVSRKMIFHSTGDIAFEFSGGTNAGVLKWMEDEDYFQFDNDVVIDTLTASQYVKTDSSKMLVSHGVIPSFNFNYSRNNTATRAWQWLKTDSYDYGSSAFSSPPDRLLDIRLIFRIKT